ncbi:MULTISPECIES: AAA family ATPase [unclassified Psychrobacillus]|uniref:AAA family ATPase n=1 Tax=unclassified Psychrobacillus TaxID=2636677 RepID=UPI0030FB3C1F
MSKGLKMSGVSIAMYKQAMSKVIVGDEVLLRKDPTNEYDKFAIKMLNKDTLEELGYISSPKTVREDKGCVDNTVVFSLMKNDETIVRVSEKFVDRMPRGGQITVVVLEQVVKAEKPSQAQELIIQIGGTKTQFPVRFGMIDEIRGGRNFTFKLVIENEKVVAYMGDDRIGYAMDKSTKDYNDVDDIKAAIEEMDGELTALTFKVDRTTVICKASVDMTLIEQKKAEKQGKKMMENLITDGILSKEEIEDRVTTLQGYGVTPKQQLALFASMVKYADPDVAMRIPPKPSVMYQDSTGIVKKSVAYINMKRNLLLEGERGVGKNVLTETIAWLFARPLYEFSLNSGHDNNSLLGGKTIETLPDGTTKMGFSKESVVDAAENGGFIVFDEFNTAISSSMSIFNSLLDDRRRIQVPGYQLVEAHENFVAIATQNRNYQGTFDNNEATIDRFVPIIFPELKGISNVIINKVKEVKSDTLNVMEKVFESLQKLVRDGEVNEKAMTIRGFIDAALAVNMDIELKDALTDNIVNRMGDEDERLLVQSMIDDITG